MERLKSIILERNIHISFFVSLLLSFTILFFAPTYMFFTNIDEFPYAYSSIGYLFFAIMIIITVILTVILSKIDQRYYKSVISLVFVVGLLFWIQGSIFVWNYGLLDGRQIEWSKFYINGIIDTAVWLSLIIFTIIRYNIVYKILKKTSMILVFIQLVSLIVVAVQAPPKDEWKKYSFSEDGAFDFSNKQNIVILVLDTFQTDIFQEILNEDNSIAKSFDGFTYFRNSVGGFSTTLPSPSLILTGNYYDNSVPIKDYIRKQFNTSSIPMTLKKNNFMVQEYPIASQTVYPDPSVITNVVRNNSTIQMCMENIENMYKITMFRYSPHFLKKYFYSLSTESQDITSNKIFFERVQKEAKVINSSSNTFKYYHIRGAHAPFTLDKSLKQVELPQNRIGQISQSKAAITVATKFLKQLKQIGIYDDSMVIIVGDHGYSYDVNTDLLNKISSLSNVGLTPQRIVASGIPLILVKPFNERGELKVFDAPVCLSDIPKTILDELKISNNFPGRPMFSVSEAEKRERRFMSYTWEHEYWDRQYLPSILEYKVNDVSWFCSSWIPTYKEFNNDGVMYNYPARYKYGQLIQCKNGGNGTRYLGYGWGYPEGTGTWIFGNSSTMVIPVKETKSDLELKIKAIPYLTEKLKQQNVNVYVGNKKIGSWKFKESGEQEKIVYIPNSQIKDSKLIITLELPNAASPYDLGMSEDTRSLGLFVETVSVKEVTPYSYGTTIAFDTTANPQHYLIGGWSNSEGIGTWTEGYKSDLVIPISKVDEDLKLYVDAAPFFYDTRQHVNVLINDKKVTEWVYETEDKQEKTVIIPKELIRGSLLHITFEIPNAQSPKNLNRSDDGRMLGIFVNSIKVDQNKE